MRITGGPIGVVHVADPASVDGSVAAIEETDERFSVETVSDADDALAQLDGGVDCVVAGYDLPGRDGVELLEAVREEHDDLPFILYANEGREAIASDAVSAGVTDYIPRVQSQSSGRSSESSVVSDSTVTPPSA